MRLRSLTLLLIPALAAAAERPELPVRQVVLYASGVGYVEHAGNVAGDAEVELRFQGGQLNDALKSLVAEDAGGSVGTAVYPSQDPLEKTLASFQVNLAGDPTLGSVLGQLRGAAATVRFQGEVIAGSILGVETRTRDLGDRRTVTLPVLSILSGGTVRQIPLDEAAVVTLEDKRLQEELARALSVIAQGRDQDKRPLLLHFHGNGPRAVRVGYVIEMPLWKTSYRLVLPAKAGGKAALQGWALVDNQTDTDWRDIRLSLVSGRPIGFVQDLAKPRYQHRPVIDAPEPEAPKPMAFLGGRALKPRPMVAEADTKEAAVPAAAMNLGMSAPMDITASVHTAAATEDLGALFRYAVEGVNLPRQRSAMIPIITESCDADLVSIYRPTEGGRHPLAGAWITNTTGKLLLAGPMTVLSVGAYAGDALVAAVPAGAKRLIAYAVDLPVTVDGATQEEQRRVTSGKLVQGTLVLSTRLEARRTYRLTNEDAEPRTVVIEHPVRPGWTLAKAPTEVTDTIARYTVTVPAQGQAELAVVETLVTDEHVVIGDLPPEAMQSYSTTGELPKAVREALVQVAALRAQVTQAEAAVTRLQTEREEIVREQGRLRDNLRTLNQASTLAQRLTAKLDAQETRLEALDGEVKTARTTLDQARARLAEHLKNLTLE